jgi:hypothetical protein
LLHNDGHRISGPPSTGWQALMAISMLLPNSLAAALRVAAEREATDAAVKKVVDECGCR